MMFIMLFLRGSVMNGVEFSAETRVAIGTNLHASFLHRKWTWALQCYLQT